MRTLILALLVLSPVSAWAQNYVATEQITVSNTAIGFTAATINQGSGHPQALQASCRLEGAQIRVAIDGNGPTDAIGTQVEIGDVLQITGHDLLTRFRAIRTGGTDATLNCIYVNTGAAGASAFVIVPGSASVSVDGTNEVTGPDEAPLALDETLGNVLSELESIRLAMSADANKNSGVIDTGPQVMYEAKDVDGSALPNQCTEGNACRPAVGLAGTVLSFITNEAGTLSPLVVEDVAETADNVLMGAGTVRRDAPASSAGATGENATVNTSALGAVYVAHIDPCSYKAKSVFVVNVSTAVSTEIANAVASEFFYICSINLVAAGAQTVAFVEDDTDAIASPTAGLNGGTTAATGWSFAANGGLTLGNGSATVMKTATANRYFGFITGQSAQLSGTVVYVSAP